jgi:hypothetical protein
MRTLKIIALVFATASSAAIAQTRLPDHMGPANLNNGGMFNAARPSPQTSLDGKWTYRSYFNRPEMMVGDDAKKALSLLFGEGVMTLAVSQGGKVTGTFDMGDNYVLDLSGTVATSGGETVIRLIGPGRPNTPTAGWEYDYAGTLAYTWPTGVDQIPAIVGTVLRAKPHGPNAPAGVTTSFMAVKQP